MLKIYLLVIFITAELVRGQTDIPTSDILNSINPGFQGKVDGKQIEEFKNKSSTLFRDKCEKNGGIEAFKNAESALTVFKQCVEELVNISKLQIEIEEAKPNGKVDEVFKKYCAKTPDFKYCYGNLTESVKPCFTESEQKNFKVINNITEELAGFICFKEGDRIALFIAEGGPECFQEKQELLQECVNRTLGSDFQYNFGTTANNLTLDALPTINFDKKKCADIVSMQQCVVSVLENCTQPTTGNIVESLFKYLYKVTPCKQYDLEIKEKNSGNGLNFSFLTIAAVISFIMFDLM